jgi:hypothetical protein
MEDNVLMKFWQDNNPDDSLIHKNAAWHQRDYFDKMGRIASVVTDEKVIISVVGAHTSKSVRFPVVEYSFKNGSKLTVRDNLHNFAVSVYSKVLVPAEMIRGIGGTEDTNSSCCEGFPEDKVYKGHAKSQGKFTTHIWDQDMFSYFMIAFAKLQRKNK